jgi:hypoxanthine phosphoribosyltransferase
MQIQFSSQNIQNQCRILGRKITEDYRQSEVPLVIGVLTGSVYFFADLTRQIKLDIGVDFVKVSSYVDNEKVSEPILLQDVGMDVEGKELLVVEDIVDTGETVEFLRSHFLRKGAKSVKVVSLLRRITCQVKVDYVGYNIGEGKYVVGYGLDNKNYFRNLKDIYTV